MRSARSFMLFIPNPLLWPSGSKPTAVIVDHQGKFFRMIDQVHRYHRRTGMSKSIGDALLAYTQQFALCSLAETVGRAHYFYLAADACIGRYGFSDTFQHGRQIFLF